MQQLKGTQRTSAAHGTDICAQRRHTLQICKICISIFSLLPTEFFQFNQEIT